MANKCPKCDLDNTETARFCSNCATPLSDYEEAIPTKTLETPQEELTRGSVFAGRYEIIEELGKGGMGKVYRVEDNKVKEEVALKLIKPEIAADKKTIERFRNELKIARKIRHKNVCAMFDLGEEEGSYYITMDFIPGQDLKGLIRQTGRLAIPTAISIGKQVCDGLAEAHRLGVIHRDLKPSNIMIDKEGDVRIMDFGIARTLKEKGITGAGVMIGTPEYMSPEQVEAKETDQRSDIYSLGIIMYEMVTGRLPFEADTPFAVGIMHKSEIPKSPQEVNPQIPDDLNQVILRCLEKDKENRYQSTSEVKSELENIEQGIPTADRVMPKKKPLTSREITVQFSLKKTLLPVFIAVIVIVAGLLIWQPWIQKSTPPTGPEEFALAVLPFEDQSPEKDLGQFCGGIADHIIAKLLKLKEWKVVNWPSAMYYENTDKSVAEIGQELNVTHLLTGTVRRESDDIQITARLIDTSDNSIIWQSPYEKELEEIFDIQSAIAGEIAAALKVELSPEEKSLLERKSTENLKAYELYTQGRFHWNKRTIQDFTKSIDYFLQAVELDPGYALAYAGLADSYVLLGEYGYSAPQQYFDKAKGAAQKALELDDSLAEAHTTLAYLKTIQDWDWKGAEIDYKKAIDLNPYYATAHQWYAELLEIQGRLDEALEESLLTWELDPLSNVINVVLGKIYLSRREYDEALRVMKRTQEMDPDFWVVYSWLGLAYCYNSMYEEALASLDEASKRRTEEAFSLEVMGEFVKHLLKDPDALIEFKSRAESAGQDLGTLEEFKKQMESLLDNRFALAVTAKRIKQSQPEVTKFHMHGLVYAKMGKKEEIQQILEETVERGKLGFFYSHSEVANLHFLLGNNDLGLSYLEKAVADRDWSMRYIKVDPLYDEVRSDPRFQALLKKMGLD